MGWRRTERKPEREQRADWRKHVAIPLGQSVVIGAGVAVGVLVVGLILTIWRAWPFWIPFAAAGALGGLSFALGAVLLVADHRRLIWAAEVALGGVDLDGDNVVGPPEVERRLIYVRDPARQRRQERARDFRHWLGEAYNDRGTTWRTWRGRRLPSGREVTRPLWEEYTERLLKAGLASRPYETAPLELESTYREALAAFREIL